MSIWDRYNDTAMLPFRVAAQKYIDNFDGKDLHRTTLCVNNLLLYVGDTPIIDVNDSSLEPFKKDRFSGSGMFSKPVMAGTVNKELTVASTILNRACRDWDMIPRVPRIRGVRGPVRRAYPLTWEEQERLFSEFRSKWDVGAWIFAVNTGVRKGELLRLKWTDMREIPEMDTFVFILTETKNGQDRAVICNSLARRAVKHQMGNGSEFVFPKTGPTRIHSSGKVFARNWVKAGLPADKLVRKGPHNLRHTFGQRLRAAEVPDEDRALLLGHANASLVQHYAAGDIVRLNEMAERVTKRRDSVILRAH